MDGTDFQSQQLVELLAVVSSATDEAAATLGAVERAAQTLEAEVAAVVVDDRVVTSVGFPAGSVPAEELAAVARQRTGVLAVPGAGRCATASAELNGTAHGFLLLARSGEDVFSVEEYNLIRGMARVLDLTLSMLRVLAAERSMREHSERQAAENARLLESLRLRQRLMEHLYGIQRAISRRVPLQEVLESIVRGAQDLLGDDIVGLWLLDSDNPEQTLLVSAVGLPDAAAKRLWRMPVAEAGAAGRAIRTDAMSGTDGYAGAAGTLRTLTRGRLQRSLATPVHESGKIAGSLMTAACTGGRSYSSAEQEILLSFAEHVSLAVTDAKTLNDMHQAFHDSLTGLASRALFLDRLQHGLACCERDDSRVALLFIDLDRFKEVNDTLGHAAGDMLLIGVAERLQSRLRGGDVAARFGGDEFAVMLQDITSRTQATVIADRIIAALAEPFALGGRKVLVNASIGVTFSRAGDGYRAEELLRQADVAMYRAKRNGRGRREVFAPEMEQSFQEESFVEHQVQAGLRQAIDRLAHGAVSTSDSH